MLSAHALLYSVACMNIPSCFVLFPSSCERSKKPPPLTRSDAITRYLRREPGSDLDHDHDLKLPQVHSCDRHDDTARPSGVMRVGRIATPCCRRAVPAQPVVIAADGNSRSAHSSGWPPPPAPNRWSSAKTHS